MQVIWIVVLGVIVLTIVLALAATMHSLLGKQAAEVVAWTAVEKGFSEVEEWEVRAMAAFVFEKVPQARWLRYFIVDYEFESLCVSVWKRLMEEYAEAEPRECRELFGDTGPW